MTDKELLKLAAKAANKTNQQTDKLLAEKVIK